MGKFGKRSIRSDGLYHHEASAEVLDLHQVRAHEAEEKIDRFVNDCVMRGVTRIKIVHGRGKGVMRQLAEKWLREHGTLVESFQSFGPGFEVELLDIGHHARRN